MKEPGEKNARPTLRVVPGGEVNSGSQGDLGIGWPNGQAESPVDEPLDLRAAAQTLRAGICIRLLRLIQLPFASIFWLIERRVSKIEDRLNARTGR